MFSTQPFDIHIHSQASSKSTSYRRLSCSSSIRSELNSIESGMFGLFFFVRGILTNCCYPESGQPRHCLGICAQPHQRFNTYCFKLHQSLPPPALALSILPRLIFLCLFLLLCLFIFLSFNFSSHYFNSRCLFIIFLFPLFHSYPFTPICFILVLPQSFSSSLAGSPPLAGSSFFPLCFSVSSTLSLSLKSWASFWN